MKNKNVVSFNIDKINYIINDASVEENWGKKLDEINNKKWDGKDIINKTLKIFNEKCKDYKSNFNHQTQDILNLEGIKNRVHIGLLDHDEKINELNYDNLYCYDINKCYSSILQNPLEKWLKFDFKDIWVKFKYDDDDVQVDVKNGLYYVDTNDITLFHKQNIYSSSIVNFGLKEALNEPVVRRQPLAMHMWYLNGRHAAADQTCLLLVLALGRFRDML